MSLKGVVELPLHVGGVPPWLLARMLKLSKVLMTVIVAEEGPTGLLRKLSDPLWFQAFSCILGFDWNSGGTTTVTCGVIKKALEEASLGVRVAGGKGARSRKTLEELEAIGASYGLTTIKIEEAKRASRLTAKVDSAAIQDGYSLYHHCTILSEGGCWAVVQQGMNVEDKTARRYHWLSMGLNSFVNNPHEGIVGDVVKPIVLNMTAEESEGCRRASVDLVAEGPLKVERALKEAKSKLGGPLDLWLGRRVSEGALTIYKLAPDSLNWEVMKRAYEANPRSYEELLEVRGLGPMAIRALALIADLVYGEPPSWRDPIKFSFAFGGKDGVPRPINRRLMDRVVSHLKGILEASEIERKERLKALSRLKGLVERVG